MSIAFMPGTSKPVASEFEELYREHSRMVYRTAYTITGNHQDADDVLQNIFVALLERRKPSDLGTNPRAYLYRAAVNMSLTTIRSRNRRRLATGIELLEAPALATDAESDEHIHRSLRDAVARLKPRAVEMLILRYQQGLSDMEIATMLGKSRGTVAVTLYRTRERLKKMLGVSSGGNDEA